MKFQSEQAELDWQKDIAANQEDYGKAVLDYARRWAETMEAILDVIGKEEFDESFGDIAKRTSYWANTDGITGFMYGAAVSILARTWLYGEQLRQWHNLDCQIGDEGERANQNGGTLNPALLSIG